MFEEVNTNEKLAIFNNIWQQCWLEKGYELELSNAVLERFLVRIDGEYQGTIELKKLKGSQIEEVFPFSSFEYIKVDFEYVVEIDKLSILPPGRRKNALGKILSLLTYYSKEYDIRQYIGLMEPKLYIALKRFYRIPVIKLGEKFYYKGDNVVPISIDPRQIYQYKENYDWITYAETLKV